MGKRVLLHLFDTLSGVITIIPALLAAGGAFAGHVHPAQHAGLQWMGLFLPLLLVINLVLMLYWMVRRKGWFLFPMLGILLNIPYLAGTIQWPVKEVEPPMNELNVATYNIQRGGRGGLQVTGPEIARFMEEKKVDILCFQEFPVANGAALKAITKIFRLFPYYKVTSSSPDGMHVALFSRYPILQSGEIRFPGENSTRALWADLAIDGQTVRVFNAHLQTTNLNQNRIDPSGNMDATASRVIRLKDMMDENSVTRANQADLLRGQIDESPHPVIVCGDFNDTPASYAYKRIRGDRGDSFRSAGKGYGYSYRYLRKLFRIDYLLYSREDIRAVHYASPELEYSDHKPVIVKLDVIPVTRSRKNPAREEQNQK